MSFNVTISSDFAKEAKRISEKHPGIKADIAKLIADLEENPKMGTDLGQNWQGPRAGRLRGTRSTSYIPVEFHIGPVGFCLNHTSVAWRLGISVCPKDSFGVGEKK